MIDESGGQDDQPDLLAAHPLVAPLTPSQQQFVDVLFQQMTSGAWPIFDWVRRKLRSRGIDAVTADPDTPPPAIVELTDVLQRVQGNRTYLDYVDLIGSILSREEPMFGCASRSGQVESITLKVNLRDDLIAYLGVADAEDYLRRLLISMGVDQPTVLPTPTSTRSRSLNRLGSVEALPEPRHRPHGLVIDPTKDYQGTGAPKGPTRPARPPS